MDKSLHLNKQVIYFSKVEGEMSDVLKTFVILLFFVFFYWIFATAATPLKGEESSSLDVTSGHDITDLHIIETDSQGLTTWELTAQKAFYLKKGNEAELKHFTAAFFSKKRDKITLRGNEGKFFHQSRNVKITGDIVVDVRGYFLTTREIEYNGEDRLASCAGPITITGPKLNMNAAAMLLYVNTQTFNFTGGVQARLQGLEPDFSNILFKLLPFE